MNEFHLSIQHRNSKELTAYVAENYEMFGKILKERGLVK
jgi:hypothetical protein